jgi:hypothetical protein
MYKVHTAEHRQIGVQGGVMHRARHGINHISWTQSRDHQLTTNCLRDAACCACAGDLLLQVQMNS